MNLSITLPDCMHAKMKAAAARDHRTLSGFIQTAVAEKLNMDALSPGRQAQYKDFLKAQNSAHYKIMASSFGHENNGGN